MLLSYFERDERYVLLVGDMGFGAIDRLRTTFPDRVINAGIMEQGTVGIAAGMAMSGMVPIYYSIVNFLVFRAIEQMRNDVVLQDLNVKFIGTGANDYFQFLGPSHCCGTDDIKIMEMIHMPVYDPYQLQEPEEDAISQMQFQGLIDQWITDARAGYLRV